MFRTIVIGLDGSERSLKALLYGQNLGEKYGAKLILVHAYPHTSDLRDFEGYASLLARRKNSGERVLDSGAKMLADTPIAFERDLLEGPAAEAVMSVAETRKADLIILGTRGMGAVKGLVFGSVATKVSHHAPCPVLLIR
ncbi:MAG: universal stress protein [Desulfobacteraceae bacterium]|jgi:nucleotide-binding universal stress UspA family protein